ncbi:tRNA1(Val) (adenine(37)-N6)-methyltransferase [Helicobacter ailurogastricus]|uniref:tRNA1(Val) (adenine(37)-N6)-methyltransferase n=1 Tax=Helicobacter ailurogastricus TaxID=1578720 RepID=UPI000CF0E415|nr:methyltransferase [Helicobacter ailurogastricus]GLH57936.1 O-methyltransferase [Helicobacter ailurogastricus]GLH59443.1 O-methyltransferase [Helicobacter ailurogastricus]
MRFYQPLKGYAYNSASLFLAHFAMPFIKKGDRLLDVGAGCGVVGLLCARQFANPLDLIEIDSEMATFAKLNCQNVPNARVHHSDFLTCSLEPNFYGVVLSNPPYYPKDSLKSPHTQKAQATNQSYLPLLEFCAKVARLLKPQGYFVLCYHASLADSLLTALQRAKLKPTLLRFVHPFYSHKASLVICAARKASKSPLMIAPPLITHNSKDQQDNTPEVALIYEKFKTHSIKASLA